MAWDHGYFSAASYTCGAYRELAKTDHREADRYDSCA